MGFQHPQQRQHMMRGIAAAAKSPLTPAHLKPHLARLAAVPQPAQPVSFNTQVQSKENQRDVMPRPAKKKAKKKPSPITLAPQQPDPFYG